MPRRDDRKVDGFRVIHVPESLGRNEREVGRDVADIHCPRTVFATHFSDVAHGGLGHSVVDIEFARPPRPGLGYPRPRLRRHRHPT
jgi:hypothetical protein